MPIYNKLVRDRIPEIIFWSGKTNNSRILSNQENNDKLILWVNCQSIKITFST